MADTPTRTDTPPPPPPQPPERSLKPSPEMQQKLDSFREQKEAKQDAGQMVDHRQAKAENQAAREQPHQAGERAADASKKPEGQERGREPDGLRPTPEVQQKMDDFRAQKEARQDAGQAVDHRPAKADNQAQRDQGTTPQRGEQQPGIPRQPAGEQLRPRSENSDQTAPNPAAAVRENAVPRQPTGDQTATRQPTGDQTATRHADGDQAATRHADGDQAATRQLNGDQVAARQPSGEQVGPRHAAAEQADPRPATGEQVAPRHAAVEQTPAGQDQLQGNQAAAEQKTAGQEVNQPGATGQNTEGTSGTPAQDNNGTSANNDNDNGSGGPTGPNNEYTGPERRQHEAQHLDPADDLRKQPEAEQQNAEQQNTEQQNPEQQDQADQSAETQKRMGELRNEGHGPQRHHDPTDQQLQDRLGTPVTEANGDVKLRGDGHVKSRDHIDPMTGTTTDGVTGDPHYCNPISSRIDSPGDYVKAENHMRQLAKDSGDNVVVAPISDVLGPQGHEGMTGLYHDPANPGAYKKANFEGGDIVALYDRAPNGDLKLITMYADPPAFRP